MLDTSAVNIQNITVAILPDGPGTINTVIRSIDGAVASKIGTPPVFIEVDMKSLEMGINNLMGLLNKLQRTICDDRLTPEECVEDCKDIIASFSK